MPHTIAVGLGTQIQGASASATSSVSQNHLCCVFLAQLKRQALRGEHTWYSRDRHFVQSDLTHRLSPDLGRILPHGGSSYQKGSHPLHHVHSTMQPWNKKHPAPNIKYNLLFLHPAFHWPPRRWLTREHLQLTAEAEHFTESKLLNPGINLILAILPAPGLQGLGGRVTSDGVWGSR